LLHNRFPVCQCYDSRGLESANAAAQPLLEAGAQRTLEVVGCGRLFGGGAMVSIAPQASVCEARDKATRSRRQHLPYSERLAYGPGLCLSTGLNVMQRCLARKQASHTHAYVWKRSENSIDEDPQCLQQSYAYFDILTGQGR
jgi:hypothetical protein